MSDGDKKISFSFSKVKKPFLRAKENEEFKKNIEFVDCFDGAKGKFSYKGSIRNERSSRPELVIPMVSSKNSFDIRSRIEGKIASKTVDKANVNKESNSHLVENLCDGKGGREVTLNEIAAAEILSEIKSGDNVGKNLNEIVIEQCDKSISNKEEQSIIDYEKIPVSDFGKAMLRGMGWKPDYGIGKKPRLVPTVSPVLRPKGLGLGAKPNLETNNGEKKSK